VLGLNLLGDGLRDLLDPRRARQRKKRVGALRGRLMPRPCLKSTNLRVRLQTQRGPADAVRGVSFSLARGETLGLIGESGCGKSITAMALMGLLPEGAQVSGDPLRRPGAGGLPEAELCRCAATASAWSSRSR
jgi:ABC-type bacteriocin/lantibiotic exporter with double-glycine peptidase domain